MKIRFDRFLCDTAKRELTRDGVVIALSPKAFRLLELLLAAAPAAVRRDDLYAALWPEVFVEDVNLSNLVCEIRNALADSATKAEFVKTVRRFGYRFVCETAVELQTTDSEFFFVFASRRYPLHHGQNLLGRDEHADVRVNAPGVSRRHAVVTVAGEQIIVDDQASKNGTFVREARIHAAVSIAAGETIRLGSSSMMTLRRRRDSDSTITER